MLIEADLKSSSHVIEHTSKYQSNSKAFIPDKDLKHYFFKNMLLMEIELHYSPPISSL